MIDLLEQASEFPKLYWQERNSKEATLGYGVQEENCNLPLFGILGSSCLKKDRVWEEVDQPFFFLQKLSILLIAI